jgi:SWIM/SEC-C metal-binding protein
MARLGSKKRPVIVRVRTQGKAQYIYEVCERNGWHCIAGVEPGKPEDISDFEKLLNPPQVVNSEKIGRNDPCLCGSGKKYKKCCGAL